MSLVNYVRVLDSSEVHTVFVKIIAAVASCAASHTQVRMSLKRWVAYSGLPSFMIE